MFLSRKSRLKYYYKTRVIFTFSLVTILLVVVMARVSYLFIKNLYLEQLSEQVNDLTKMISSRLDPDYVALLNIGTLPESFKQYFQNEFGGNINSKLHSEIFIFNKEFEVAVHSDHSKKTGVTEPSLFLNEKEIFDLQTGEASSSLPFRGEDDNWYLWGFCRLNNDYWLAVRESAARFQKVEDFSAVFWYIGTGGTILTILVSLFVAGRITNPVDKLVAFSGEIGKGDFKAQRPAGMKGEFEILADAMESMKKNLAENSSEREKILAQIAHEIRNPLGGIELLANLSAENLCRLQEIINSNTEPLDKNREYLGRILKEVHGLKSLITSYLNYSRPQPGKPAWVNLNDIIKEAAEMLSSPLKIKSISLRVNSEVPFIFFDPDHLRQVLTNLILNSIDSVPEGGSITVDSVCKENRWIISVTDNGKGINEDDLSKIFEPFYTKKSNGTGLGLAITRKLCLENKAWVSAKNNPGKGAAFSIYKEVVNEREFNHSS